MLQLSSQAHVRGAWAAVVAVAHLGSGAKDPNVGFDFEISCPELPRATKSRT